MSGDGGVADGGLRVQLNVYDVLPNLSKANKVLADYIGAGGAFHCGVVVHYLSDDAKEWAFGGCDYGTGVFCTDPLALGDGNPFVFKKTIEMGNSVCEDEGVEALLAKLMDEWPGDKYDLTRRNCCHFAETLCMYLGVDQPFPAWVSVFVKDGAFLVHAAKILHVRLKYDEEHVYAHYADECSVQAHRRVII